MSIDNGTSPLSSSPNPVLGSLDTGINDPMANTKDAGDKLKGSATTALDDAKNLASAAVADAKSYAGSVAGDAKTYAGAVASDAAASFKEAVETKKTAGADAIVGLARSAQDAADKFEGQAPQMAKMVKSAAEGVEKMSTDIRDRNVGELMDSVSDFAKRQPATFFGCGILAGVILSRIMRGADRSA